MRPSLPLAPASSRRTSDRPVLPSVAPFRWQAVPQSEFLWAHWGHDPVLFHRSSGLTHFLNPSAALLLSEVLVEPRTLESAAQSLAVAEGAEPGADFLPEIAELLQRLETLGLVQRVGA